MILDTKAKRKKGKRTDSCRFLLSRSGGSETSNTNSSVFFLNSKTFLPLLLEEPVDGSRKNTESTSDFLSFLAVHSERNNCVLLRLDHSAEWSLGTSSGVAGGGSRGRRREEIEPALVMRGVVAVHSDDYVCRFRGRRTTGVCVKGGVECRRCGIGDLGFGALGVKAVFLNLRVKRSADEECHHEREEEWKIVREMVMTNSR